LDRTQEYPVERIGLYATAIAREMGLSDDYILQLTVACLIHELGRLPAVSGMSAAAAASKDADRPQSAYALALVEMLKDIKGLEDQLAYIAAQHEHFNGNGKPLGLKGTAIPLGARILAVAHAFEKLTAPPDATRDGPDYVPDPLAVRKAFTEMGTKSGAQFDPDVLHSLMASYRHGALFPGQARPVQDTQESENASPQKPRESKPTKPKVEA
jgi:HD-GYP domain-containing protein (c-di-GMP phosphodiesterase class II)